MTELAAQRGPLAGVRVTDFTWAWAGPHATLLLAFLGAEVIKIESGTRLDHSRVRSLMGGQTQGGPDASPLFNDLNLNKRSLTLDLRREEARDLVRRLVAKSDVVTQNMRPGVLERLGLGYSDLCRVRPDLIMLSSSAVGATGPERNYAGYAPTFASMSGIAEATGYPDRPPLPLSGSVDLRVGTASAFAVLAALYRRARTSQGLNIDLSSTDVMSALMGDLFLAQEMTGRAPHRMGNADDRMCPHNAYRTAREGAWVSLAVASEEEWTALKGALGLPELSDPAFATPVERRRNVARLDALIEGWTGRREPEEIAARLQRAGVAALRVLDGAQAGRQPQAQARGVLEAVEHPLIGVRQVVGAPWRFGRDRVGVRSPAPLLGQHNDYVLSEILGLAPDEIERLRESGVLN